jgi:hypothetical protein
MDAVMPYHHEFEVARKEPVQCPKHLVGHSKHLSVGALVLLQRHELGHARLDISTAGGWRLQVEEEILEGLEAEAHTLLDGLRTISSKVVAPSPVSAHEAQQRHLRLRKVLHLQPQFTPS